MAIEVVARNWDRPDWCGAFYPEDLPDDWRLAYFANAFEAVLVPAPTWHRTPPGRLSDWVRDVPERFRFYLELGPGDGSPVLARAAVALGNHLAGSVAGTPVPGGPGSALDGCAAPSPLLPAWDAAGDPILARPIPAGLLDDPRSALNWLQMLAAAAGPRPALAILGDAPADSLTRWCQLVLLGGLA
jgi:hypothetical protein